MGRKDRNYASLSISLAAVEVPTGTAGAGSPERDEPLSPPPELTKTPSEPPPALSDRPSENREAKESEEAEDRSSPSEEVRTIGEIGEIGKMEGEMAEEIASESDGNRFASAGEERYSGESLDSLALENARMPPPEYPSLARRMEWEGDVTVSFIITPKGRAESLTIEKSSGYEVLDEAVADMVVRGWRFPRRETPIRVWKTFSFRLI